MRVITICGRELVFPLLGWAKPPNFKNISDEERNELEQHFQKIIEKSAEVAGGENKEAKRIELIAQFQELSATMFESNDICLRALGSQIELTASILEMKELTSDNVIDRRAMEIISDIRIESIERNDYPRGFYLNTLLFYKWFQSIKDISMISVNRIELGNELMKTGEELKKSHSVNLIDEVFNKYCNKRMRRIETMPEILFLINYLKQVFTEHKTEIIEICEDEKFCKFFGGICRKIGIGLKYQDRALIASAIFKLYEFADKKQQ